jgi:hypothetical protein
MSAVRPQPARNCPVPKGQFGILWHVDVGEDDLASGPQVMLSQDPVRYRFAAYKRLIAFHGYTIARRPSSKLRADRDLWMNRDL